MIKIREKSKCCGCAACYNACPHKCIAMKPDVEGFLYPVVDEETCVNCGICERICPVLNIKEEEAVSQKGYIVQHKDDVIRIDSTSGGAFTAIAQYVLSKNGIAFGVALDENLHAYHTYADSVENLKNFRNSKYMQSNIRNVYNECKKFLDSGRMVLFSGTGCQIEGLKNYLRKDYQNLFTVDVVCRAVPSPMIFDKYLEFEKEKIGAKVTKVRFRDKYYGYKYSTMNIETDENNLNYHLGVESDPWLRAFFSNICDRPSCHECTFKKQFRVSDMTIWDCFSVGTFSKEMDDDKGATRILVHSPKGIEIVNKIRLYCNIKEIPVELLVAGVKELVECTPKNSQRSVFFKDANMMDGVELFEKYFPLDSKVKLKHSIRLILNRLGIYSFIKSVVWKLKDKN